MLSPSPPLPGPRPAIERIPSLSQKDPRWSGARIGASDVTVGSDGCLVTCLAMLSCYYGSERTPDALAADPRRFTKDGFLRWRRLGFPGFSLRWRERGPKPGAPARDDALIGAYLPRPDDPLRRSVVLAVAGDSHWVLPVGYDEAAGEYEALDPKSGSTIRVLATYGSISGSAHFVGGHVPAWRRWLGRRRPAAPGFE